MVMLLALQSDLDHFVLFARVGKLVAAPRVPWKRRAFTIRQLRGLTFRDPEELKVCGTPSK
jgi:hypothetical protein